MHGGVTTQKEHLLFSFPQALFFNSLNYKVPFSNVKLQNEEKDSKGPFSENHKVHLHKIMDLLLIIKYLNRLIKFLDYAFFSLTS